MTDINLDDYTLQFTDDFSNDTLTSNYQTEIKNLKQEITDIKTQMMEVVEKAAMPKSMSDLSDSNQYLKICNYTPPNNNLTDLLKANYNAAYNHTLNTSNPHSVTKAQVGLGNVDNTSDVNKPISTAIQAALNLKANDGTVVHLSGAETLSGAKTFSSALTVAPLSATNALIINDSSGNVSFQIKNPTASLANTFIGLNAANTSVTGSRNTVTGYYSGQNLLTGTSNSLMGYYAGATISTGSFNTCVGDNALASNNGDNNTAIGCLAGNFTTDGFTANTGATNCVYLGKKAMASAVSQTNEIVIGYFASGAGSNTATIGNSNITKTVLHGVVIMGSASSAPTGVEGGIYYNSADKHFYGYNGTAWKQLDN